MADENTVVVTVPFVGGLDQKQAREYVDPSSAQADIVNGEFAQLGAIDQRLGLEHLPNGEVPGSDIDPISDGVRLTSWSKSTVTAMGTGGLYSFSDAQQGLVGVSELPAVVARRSGVTTSPTQMPPTFLDLPYNGRTLRVAIYWDANFSIAASVTDLDSGDVVLQPTTIFNITGSVNAGTIPVLVSAFYLPLATAARQAVISVFNNQNSTLYCLNYDPTTNSFTSPTSIAVPSGVGAIGVVDVVPFQNYPGGGIVAVWSTSTTTFRLRHIAADFTTVVLTKDVTLTAGQTMTYPLYAVADYAANNSECCWVFFETLQGANFRLFYLRMAGDGTFATELGGPVNFIVATTTQFILSGACRFAARRAHLQVTRSQNPSSNGATTVDGFYYTFDGTDPSTAGTLNAFGHTPYGFWPMFRPFAQGGSVYQVMAYDLYLNTSSASSAPRSRQVTCYLMKYRELDSNVGSSCVSCMPVATVAPRIVDQSNSLLIMLFSLFRRGFMSAMEQSSAAGRYACGIRTSGQGVSSNAGSLGPAWAVDYLFDQETLRDLYQPTELGQELGISGAVPFVADGNIAFEENFFMYPEFSTVRLGGSGITNSGQYIYALVFTYVDAAGLKHRGSPSFTSAITVPGGGGQGAIVSITPCSATWRDVANPGTVYCEVYRTLSNGSTFYFLDRIAISNTQSAVVTWPSTNADNHSDANLATASLLYTTGSAEIDTVNPPASLLHIGHKNRRAIVDETGQAVWMTTEFDDPLIAPGWNEGITQEFPEGGRITALASMDGAFYVFKYSSIWVMNGDGPLNTGLQSNWSVPESISTDTGAVGWRGVVATPVGIVFRSPVGFYVLRRNRQVEYVGDKVQTTLAAFPNVTSAVLVPDATQVRFTCENEAGSDSIVIVYDYLHGYWTTYDYEQLSDTIASAALVGSPPRYGILTSDGELWREKARTSATAYLDENVSDVNQFVQAAVESAQFRIPGGVQAWQRFRVVQLYCERLDDCGLQLEVLDANGDVLVTKQWYSDELAQLPSPCQVMYTVGSRWTRSRALSFRWTSTAGASMTTGRGMRFINMSVEIENIGPRYKTVPALGRR